MNILKLCSGREITNAQNADSESFSIECKLIPLSQRILFTFVLIVLITWFGFIIPTTIPGRTLIALMDFGLITFIVATAAKLRMRVSELGIEATSKLHKQSLYGRVSRPWQDLHSVRLRKFKSPAALLERLKLSRDSRLRPPSLGARLLRSLGKGWGSQGFLILDFSSGGMLAFPLAGFSREALENFSLAISRWADPMTLNPDVIALQRDILTGQEVQITDSYTKMWEESLRQRFEVTNFVPLLGGQELKNGQLKILILLACGGLSSIYLARDRQGKRLVVKEMAVPMDSNDAALSKIHEMFAREAQILAKLDHPQIVKVMDHFVEKSRDYLVLEFVPGLSLRQQVQMHGPFAEPEVIKIGEQIADILQYLHGCSSPIIHRDLTPDNIVIREPDRSITLIDFGAANEFVGKVTGTLIGKQCYIPPEQFRGHGVPQSDLYALGATLHFLLTGQDPEPISVSHPKRLRGEVSNQLDSLISKLTAVEAEDRHQCTAEVLAHLKSTRLSNSTADRR